MDGSNLEENTEHSPVFNEMQSNVEEYINQAEPAEFSPFGAVSRLMRGRWLVVLVLAPIFGAGLGFAGFSSGKAIFQSLAIVRISARDPGILYADGDPAKLKLFNSFVKGETTFLASHAVMERAFQTLKVNQPEFATDLSAQKLAGFISIKRNDAMIIVKSKSTDANFAAQKVNAVVDGYIALHEESKQRLSSFRQKELTGREALLLNKLKTVNASILDVGSEYGMASLVKTHIEKVAHIESLVSRRAEVAATLLAMESSSGTGSADMADQEIIRATLLDRGLADLNFEKAKQDAELSALLLRYSATSPQVVQKKDQIKILDQAMANRRNQIQVLGQTGALTDGSQSSKEESTAEIKALLEKVTGQLDTARVDARRLNSKRIHLTFLEEERDHARKMLDETRRALDIIQVESRNSMPGLVEVISRAIAATESESDSRKLLAVGGIIGGAILALLLVFGFALTRGRIRFSDDLWSHVWQVPLLGTIGRKIAKNPQEFTHEINKARNNIQLFPSRTPKRIGQAQIIAVCRFDTGDSLRVSNALANSFATAQLRTLMIDVDLAETRQPSGTSGWRELVVGGTATITSFAKDQADVIGTGKNATVSDATVSVGAIRSIFQQFSETYDVIVVNAGELSESLSAELVLSASDLAIGVVAAGDRSTRVNSKVTRLESLPCNGGGLIFSQATAGDPALTA